MDIKRSGSQPSSKGPAEYFTGTMRIAALFQAIAPARAYRRHDQQRRADASVATRAPQVDEWDWMFDVNIKGVLYGIVAALPHMKQQKAGHITTS